MKTITVNANVSIILRGKEDRDRGAGRSWGLEFVQSCELRVTSDCALGLLEIFRGEVVAEFISSVCYP